MTKTRLQRVIEWDFTGVGFGSMPRPERLEAAAALEGVARKLRQPPVIVSLTPGKAEAEARAQRLANIHGEAYGVWEHVGLYGDPTGDVPATHAFKTMPLNDSDPASTWALVACVDPEGV